MNHRPELDGLRFVAFGLVFAHHALQFHPTLGELPFVRFGFYGVNVFFVLSGFLIGGILRDLVPRLPEIGRARALGLFYARRALRIFPLYYAVLAALALRLVLRGRGDELAESGLAWHATYTTNVLCVVRGVLGDVPQRHFWSLAVEEHFYLLAPVVLFRVSPAWFARATLGLVVAAVSVRVGLVATEATRPWTFLSPLQFDSMAVGVCVALLARGEAPLGVDRGKLRTLGFGGAAVFCAALALETFELPLHAHGSAFAPPALALAVGALVLALWEGRVAGVSRVLGSAPFVYLGRISYGLYVFHPLCLGFTSRWAPLYSPANAGLALALTIAVSSASFHAFEWPIQERKRHFPYAARGTSEKSARAAKNVSST